MRVVSDAELDGLAAKARAATPGPWQATSDRDGSNLRSLAADAERRTPGGWVAFADYVGAFSSPADAEYLAAADPSTVGAIAAELKRLRAAVQALFEWANDAGATSDFTQRPVELAVAKTLFDAYAMFDEDAVATAEFVASLDVRDPDAEDAGRYGLGTS